MNSKPVEFLGHYVAGMNQISASDLNTLIQAAKQFKHMSAVPPLGMQYGAGGVSFFLKETFIEMFLAKLISMGPSSEDPYTDERYWFRRVYCSTNSGDEYGKITFETIADGDPNATHSTATNLGELADETHNVPTSEVVAVFSLQDDQAPFVKHYYFWYEDSGIGIPAAPSDGKTYALTAKDGVYTWAEIGTTSVVSGVSYSGGEFAYNTRSITVLSLGSAGGPISITGTTECDTS